jgi:hypothetical protein
VSSVTGAQCSIALTLPLKCRKLSIPWRSHQRRWIDTLPETTMSDNKGSDKKHEKPKDLPAKPVDKKTDDKVKGGYNTIKLSS